MRGLGCGGDSVHCTHARLVSLFSDGVAGARNVYARQIEESPGYRVIEALRDSEDEEVSSWSQAIFNIVTLHEDAAEY